MLRGARFVRVYEGVWRLRDHPLSFEGRLDAARLALPADARLTGITRIQTAGARLRPARHLVRFVVARDLHLDLPDVFLHRTVRHAAGRRGRASPRWRRSSPTAPLARVIDADQGRRLALANGHLDWVETCMPSAWTNDGEPVHMRRCGCSRWLDGDSWSLRESEVALDPDLRRPAVRPRSNVGAALQPTTRARIGDLVYRKWGVDVEYEGEHHQLDRAQYLKDIDRYASMRREQPRRTCRSPRRSSPRPRRHGPRGVRRPRRHAATTVPAPSSGSDGCRLFARVSDVVAAERRCLRARFEIVETDLELTASPQKPTLTHRHPATPASVRT